MKTDSSVIQAAGNLPQKKVRLGFAGIVLHKTEKVGEAEFLLLKDSLEESRCLFAVEHSEKRLASFTSPVIGDFNQSQPQGENPCLRNWYA
ncbi:MAG TPA: hypothetical protein VFV58_10620 [Blastocatellia bacterium]|jgi:hypothetical protein|nr:hypothetical protein [Blastocatellia bacterium]